jgi:hypothetical protein
MSVMVGLVVVESSEQVVTDSTLGQPSIEGSDGTKPRGHLVKCTVLSHRCMKKWKGGLVALVVDLSR